MRHRRIASGISAAIALLLASTVVPAFASHEHPQADLTTRAAPILTVDGLQFRDLNRNQRLDAYEDWRLPAEARAADLLARMTIDEKAGQMVFSIMLPGADLYDMGFLQNRIEAAHVTHFGSMASGRPEALARSANAIQALAERQRLGIPVVLGTDPRHGYRKIEGASVDTGGFSQWPGPTGLGAIGDPAVVGRFADAVRRDYRLTGFTVSLAPQADLATEPRWPRIDGTFGEDPKTVAPLVGAYVAALQGGTGGETSQGVAATVKHWVGYGAAADRGFDSHNFYGRYGALRAAQLPAHLAPFEAAFAADVSAVMPAYSIFRSLEIDGGPVEQVGAAYARAMTRDLLRTRYRFGGVVLSDWAITADCNADCRNGFGAGRRPDPSGIGMPWGVEMLSRPERFARAIANGVDQLGGETDPAPIVEAVRRGLLTERQIDDAVRRILIQSFRLGLFEHPFVDVDRAAREVGRAADREAGFAAQAQAMVVLKAAALPKFVPGRTRLFLHGLDVKIAEAAGFTVVDQPRDADIAVVRLAAPFEALHPGYFFGSMQHEGRLAFPEDDAGLAMVRSLAGTLPVVVDVYLDRPAILTPIEVLPVTLIADFGAADEVLLDVLTGTQVPRGCLPFELPRSEFSVAGQASDVPADSSRPLRPLHFCTLALARQGIAERR